MIRGGVSEAQSVLEIIKFFNNIDEVKQLAESIVAEGKKIEDARAEFVAMGTIEEREQALQKRERAVEEKEADIDARVKHAKDTLREAEAQAKRAINDATREMRERTKALENREMAFKQQQEEYVKRVAAIEAAEVEKANELEQLRAKRAELDEKLIKVNSMLSGIRE